VCTFVVTNLCNFGVGKRLEKGDGVNGCNGLSVVATVSIKVGNRPAFVEDPSEFFFH